MSFLYPAILGGLAAVSIPIAIHLLNKFRVKKIDWAAMRFLADSLRKNERRLKIEDLILLVLRCLIVAVLVLAFARPVLKALVASGDGTGPVAAVVLLDNSASMGQSGGATNRFDEARKAARDWLDGRESGSQIALFLVSSRTEAVVARPSPDFSAVRKGLEVARLSDRGTDLAPGIRLAFQTLATVQAKAREIRIYTDDQTCAWAGLEDIRKLVQEHPEIRIVPVPVGKQGENNLGIVGLVAEGGVPAAKIPVRFRVEVGNYGESAVENVNVALSIDGAPSSGEAVISHVAPGTTQTVDLTVSFPESGYHVVTATIPPDALAIDNTRTVAVDVISHLNALIVEGSEAETKIDRDGFFLANALIPLPRDRTLQYYLGVSYTTPARLDKTALSEADVVFLCNVASFSADSAQALQEYVTKGGNLVVFPGPQTDPEKWKQTSALWNLLPATLGAAKVAAAGEKSPAWQASDFEHPVSAFWNDATHGSLGSVQVRQYFPLTLKSPDKNSSQPAAIVRLANGDPAVAEWGVSQGRVVLFNSTATPEWNNLPLHPAFVPFMQRLLGYLDRRGETRLALRPGESFRQAVPNEFRGKDFFVQPPQGEHRSGGRVEAEGEVSVVRVSDTEEVGAYRIFIGKSESPVAAFAVQLDPAESDLRQANPKELEALAPPPQTGQEKTPALQMIVTREFWTNLIWVAALLALIEIILAFRFSHATRV